MKESSMSMKAAKKLLKQQMPASEKSVNAKVLFSALASTAAAVAITNAFKNRQSNPMYGTQSAVQKATRKITKLAEGQLKEHGHQIVPPILDLTKEIVESVDSSPEGREFVGQIEEYLRKQGASSGAFARHQATSV